MKLAAEYTRLREGYGEMGDNRGGIKVGRGGATNELWMGEE